MTSIVRVAEQDSIRIETNGGLAAVQLPAVLLLAADRVMRTALETRKRLALLPVGEVWHVSLGAHAVNGATPWEALRKLADVIEGER